MVLLRCTWPLANASGRLGARAMKLNEEPGLALWHDAMQDLGHDNPRHAGLEESLAGQRRFDDVA